MASVLRPQLFSNIFRNTLQHYKNLGAQSNRHYLSPAYQCLDAWNSRHNEELLKKVVDDPNKFFIEIVQKHRAEFTIWAIDVDLYVQKFDSSGKNLVPEDLEQVLQMLRLNTETGNTLRSTWHTSLRLLHNAKQKNSLFRILSQPVVYGCFVDHYLANLMMNDYLLEKDYNSAARVASQHMLVEEFGSELDQAFTLFSCLQYFANDKGIPPWVDYEVKEEEPEEVVKIRVPFIDNPFFDDHFHLKNDAPRAVGKTLSWLSPFLPESSSQGLNALLIGYSKWRKWNLLQEELEKVLTGDKKGRVAPLTVSLITEAINEKCTKDEQVQQNLLSTIDKMKVDSDYDLLQDAEQMLKDAVKKHEAQTIKKQIQTYADWAQDRLALLGKQKELLEKREIQKEIEEKKKYLKAKQQKLYFFDNEQKIEVYLEQKGKFEHPFPHTRPRRYTRIKKEVEQEDYIPPTVRGKRL